MKPLTDQALLHIHTGISKNACERIVRYENHALLELKSLIGELLLEDLIDRDNDDEERQIASRALSYLCVYHAMPMLNIRPTELGGFSRVIGFGDRQEELMSMAEMDKYRKLIYATTKQLVSFILPDEELPGNFQGNGFGFMAVGGE